MTENQTTSIKHIVVICIVISLVFGAFAGSLAGFFVGASGNYDEMIQTWNWLQGRGNHRELLGMEDEKTTTRMIREESATIEAVESIIPAVVSVVASKEITAEAPQLPFPFEDFFEPYFFEVPKQGGEQIVGSGTGFVLDADNGFILTNKHVVLDEDATYTVVTNDDKEYPATVLARDPFNDIAILQVQELADMPELPLGDSDILQLGQTVIAIGNSLGQFSNTVTTGVVSGIGRDVIAGSIGLSERLDDVIQTDAAINPGNSGGPLVNLAGEVIGINTAVSRQGQLIGFAIPINVVKPVIDSIHKHGRIVRPFLGVRYVMIDEQYIQENNVTITNGALVTRGEAPGSVAVVPDGPADLAGIREGDILVAIEHEPIDETTTLSQHIQQYAPGETITVTVYRAGAEFDLAIVLQEYNE